MDHAHNETLRSGFDRASKHYDLMVGLNPGYHRHLRNAAQKLMEELGSQPEILDLGCGSGASTKALYDEGAGQVLGVDASPGMIAQARKKRWAVPTDFEVCFAQALDTCAHPRLKRPFDGVYAAYLIRNVPSHQRDAVLTSMFKHVAVGGKIVLVEYGLSKAWLPRVIWDLVCWLTVIPLSKVIVKDTSLFRYLWKSVHEADSPRVLGERLERAGFTEVQRHRVSGWQRGILHIWTGRRT